MRVVLLMVIAMVLSALPTEAADENGDAAYVKRFLERCPKVASPPTLETYATPARYDELYMGDKLDAALKTVSNDSGGIAWGLSYRMMSLNEMYRVTQDAKYLEANLKCIRAILAATDDKIGKKLWTGRVVAAWGCDKYAERGRAIFAVHTGIITAPMLQFLQLAIDNPAFKKTLGDEAGAIFKGCMDALAVHDRQWRDGPEEGAGHYIGMDQENILENKPLPGNRLSAMGWALWASWKVTGNTTHRDRALALGHYIKNRLTPSPDGAYYWPYWLPTDPVKESAPREKVSGEDTSHAGLTMELPWHLAADNQVITAEDMQRFAKTVLNGLGRLGGGVIFGSITGSAQSKPDYIGPVARWLILAQQDAEVRARIVPYYLEHVATPGPWDLSLLLRYGGVKQ